MAREPKPNTRTRYLRGLLREANGDIRKIVRWLEDEQRRPPRKPGPEPRDNTQVILYSAWHCAVPVPVSVPPSELKGAYWGLENLEAEMNEDKPGSFELRYTSLEAAELSVKRSFERNPSLIERWREEYCRARAQPSKPKQTR